MTHDPLCPTHITNKTAGNPCRDCALIRRVREDERDNCWGAVSEIVASELWDGETPAWWIVKADALAAIEALGDK